MIDLLMLKTKLISRVLSLYEKPPLSEEYERAFIEFFADSIRNPRQTANEEIQKLFHEWFIFHFHLFTDRTPLEQFIINHLAGFSAEERMEAEALRRARFDVFEVLHVVHGKQMTVQALSDDQLHHVIEHRGSEQLQSGTWIFGRLAVLPDHAEFVGGLLMELPTQLAPESRSHWKEVFKHVTPKELFSYLLAEGNSMARETHQSRATQENQMPLDEARSRLITLFKKYDIEKFISVPQVERWCNQQRPDTTDPRWIMGIVLGLAHGTKELPNDLLDAVQRFVNAVPRKELHNQSPEQLSKKLREANRKPTIFVTNFYEWNEHAAEAHRHMAAGRIKDALASYRNAFHSLLEARTTIRDVFRLYANTAIALFAYGDEFGGQKLLERAQELNPLYDFAGEQAKRLAAGTFDTSILYGRMVALAELGPKTYRQMHNRKSAYEQEPWHQYDQMLKRFKINFHHPLDEPTKISLFSQSGKKIGRNVPCPCGSGKKFKKCHG